MKDWVSAKHMTPKSAKIVLITDGKFVTEGIFANGEWISLTAIVDAWDITHWMEKPEPPE